MNYSNYKVNVTKVERERLNLGLNLDAFCDYLAISPTNYYRIRKFGGLCTYKVYKKIEKRIQGAAKPVLPIKGYTWSEKQRKTPRHLQ